MRKAPTAIGLIFCDRLVPDPATGQVSLRGILNQIEVFDFSEPHPFTVYALLADGSGEGRLELVIHDLGEPAPRRIYRNTRWVSFVAEPESQNMELRLHLVKFNRAGPHSADLTFEGQLVSERRFRVLDGRSA